APLPGGGLQGQAILLVLMYYIVTEVSIPPWVYRSTKGLNRENWNQDRNCCWCSYFASLWAVQAEVDHN
ncbi:MAG: hypothetical protein AAGF24_02005, partial [Cyanobacteria bacterium P01_H01_bin.121]